MLAQHLTAQPTDDLDFAWAETVSDGGRQPGDLLLVGDIRAAAIMADRLASWVACRRGSCRVGSRSGTEARSPGRLL